MLVSSTHCTDYTVKRLIFQENKNIPTYRRPQHPSQDLSVALVLFCRALGMLSEERLSSVHGILYKVSLWHTYCPQIEETKCSM